MTTLADRIEICANLIGGRGALTRRSSIPRRSIDYWATGTYEPKATAVAAIAKAAGVNPGWLLTGEGPMRSGEEEAAATPADDELALVPRYDVAVSMGGGREVHSEQIVDHLAFKIEWLRDLGLEAGRLALVDAWGDSMEPTIPEGALLLVDLRPGRGWKDGIYVLRVDSGLLAKRVQRGIDGSLVIKSDNPAYDPQTVPPERAGEVQFLGRVVWMGRRI